MIATPSSFPRSCNPAYTVSILTHPSGQRCTLLNASGTAGSTPIDNIDVLCESNLIWNDEKWDERAWN